MLENLNLFTKAMTENAARYLIAFAAVGAMTMAIIQTLKEITPARAWFHRRELRRWLAHGVAAEAAGLVAMAASVEANALSPETPETNQEPARTAGLVADVNRLALSNPFRREPTPSEGNSKVERCRVQLIALATAGDAPALYALEIEKLAGQLGAAGAVVADFPKRYRVLLRCLARHADPDDVEELANGNPPPDHGSGTDKARQAAWNEYLERKVRVTHQIQRNIDGFQISTAYRWGWLVHLGSFAISFVIAWIAVVYTANRDGFDPSLFFSALPIALAAGFLAPIARDLLARLTSR
jgi:hypothetical protein